MKFIGFDDEDKAIKWANEKIGIDSPIGFARAMSSVDSNGDYVVVVVITNFGPRNVDMQIAIADTGKKITRSGGKDLFNGVFGYVFNELGVARVTGLIRSANKASCRFVEHLGFKLEGVMRDSFEDDDLCVYGFLKQEFLDNRWYHGK